MRLRRLLPLLLFVLLLQLGTPDAATGSCWGQLPPPPEPPEKEPTPTPGKTIEPPPGFTPPSSAGSRPLTPPTGGATTGGIRTPGGATRPRPRSASYAAAWFLWWELNRESLLGLRSTLPSKTALTRTETMPEMRAPWHGEVRQALRHVVRKEPDDRLKAEAVLALGRMGTAEDAPLLLGLLTAPGSGDELREAAALALGNLPATPDGETASRIRELYGRLLAGRDGFDGTTRRIAIVALGLRAGRDPGLARALAERCATPIRDRDDSAVIAYALGLSGSPFLRPELERAARKGMLGVTELDDVARSHAVLALGLAGGGEHVPALLDLLADEDARIHTRRSAAVAIGTILRERVIDEEARARLDRDLPRIFEEDRDPLVRGWTAIAMGLAPSEKGTNLLLREISKGRDLNVRPLAALALGLAARRDDVEDTGRIRKTLHAELRDTKDPQFAAALTIGLGLARATETRDEMLDRLADESLNPTIRGPAAQALGLFGADDDEVLSALEAALADATDEVVEDAGWALGLLGRHGTAEVLVDRLASAKSEVVQSHLVSALAHLGGSPAIRPLLEILGDRGRRRKTRGSAATALGILTDDRPADALFRIDVATNPWAFTLALRKIVVLY